MSRSSEHIIQKKSLIFLVGFMGSGKSTVGPILANTIGYEFVDLDHMIEERERKTISDIFAEDGEKIFRGIEQEVLQDLLNSTSTVISLGGGTIKDDATLELIKKFGIVVYLKSDLEHIFQRLKTKSDRPMLRDENGKLINGENLKLKIESLLSHRRQYYERADIIIHTDDKRIGKTIDELAHRLAHLIHQ